MTVLLFASYADAFGAPSVSVDVAEPARVTDVVAALRALPGGSVLPTRPLLAVNHRYADSGLLVHSGDELALIPPVAGG